MTLVPGVGPRGRHRGRLTEGSASRVQEGRIVREDGAVRMPTARRLQRTIARDTEVRGVGFFLGADVALRFRPAEADSGVVFVRTDLPERPTVPAHIRYVIPTRRRTSLQRGEARVEMVEHVMAALAGLRIDNCTVEINAPETPGCDGSSRAFVEALHGAGIVEL